MTVAERLPVGPVPEQLRITAMRDDVVHVRRLDVPSFLYAHDAERMLLEEKFPCFPPGETIAAFGGGPYLFRMLPGVFIAVLTSA